MTRPRVSMPIKLNRWIAQAPNLIGPPVPLTTDLPTYAPEPDLSEGRSGPGLPRPADRGDGRVEVLGQLAYHIRETGAPTVPEGVPATLVGALEGGNYVYLLGGMPDWGVDTAYFYILKEEPQGWSATPICQGAWRTWAWPGTLKQTVNPVVVCATVEGSGAVLTLAAYKGDREVLRIFGLQESGFQVIPDPAGAPPVILAYGAFRWLDHKIMPFVRERFTFVWDGDAYALAKHERMADWVYHVARFKELLSIGDLERASLHMAAPPEDLHAYLQANAPDLIAGSDWRWTLDDDPARTAGVPHFRQQGVEGGPTFIIETGPNGLITAVRQR
ncbi:MAG TPA: hypothetical protein VD969_05120 [Symbiobacteriaceae bacterium]|nr:hypothetical protein [Symbiobacteriaceae bacterium]